MKKKGTLGVFVLVSFFVFINVGCTSNEKKDASDKTNTNAALYTLKEQKKTLKNYAPFYDLAFSEKSHELQEGTYAIPGLLDTQTLLLGETGHPSISQTMDPQGVTIADDYLLISAYSHDKAHNSVIYVLNKNNHEYIKTVVLQGKPHVGGIAYDSKTKNIWVCSDTEDMKAQVVAISMDSLKKYRFSDKYEPIRYEQVVDLGDIGEASFITYHNQALYIGFFSVNHEGVLNKYLVDSTGRFDLDVDKQVTISSGNNDADPEHAYKITDKIQGITFYQEKILFSQSYGPDKSHILVFNDLNKEHLFLEKDSVGKIETPPYLEQIYADNDSLYTIFESATEIYRTREDITKVDRVLQLNLKKLIKEK